MPRRLLVIAAGALALTAAWSAPALAVESAVQTEPAPNSLLDTAPTRVAVQIPDETSVTTSDLAVRTVDHQREDVRSLVDTPEGRLSADLPQLPRGVYTVVWTATSTELGQRSGAFAFQVNGFEASPSLRQQPQPQFTLSGLDRAIPRWQAFL